MYDVKYLGSTVQRNGECGREVKKNADMMAEMVGEECPVRSDLGQASTS